MSKRTSSTVSNGVVKDSTAAVDKQKKLLSEETGHFSLIRAMHLADLITELNGIDSRDTLKGSKVLIVE